MEYYKCRLCLEITDRFVDIFQDTFPEMIEILSGIKVAPYDGLPTTSCLQCHQDVKSAMLVRYQIINSNKILLDEFKFNVETYSKGDKEEMKEGELRMRNDNYLVGLDDCDDSSIDVKPETIDKVSNNLKAEVAPETRSSKVKFRQKPVAKQKSVGGRIEFKRKKMGDSLTVKVDYRIKPEYLDFLKNIGRKERVPCPECGRVMFGMNMKNHLITHNFDPVICDICGKTSKNSQALQDHINYYHKTTPDRFMCDKCGKGYRVRFMLERHNKKEHGTGEKDFECTICGKKFFEKLHLKNHINITHKKIKAYKCEHCGKDFGRRTQFVTHQLVHTKENRYHCQVCSKGFKIKQTMQTHLKGVHGIEEEKTIFCKICQKGFSTPQGLRAHVNSRVHGLEKCDHCAEFITVEYKDIHMRDVHGIKVS